MSSIDIEYVSQENIDIFENDLDMYIKDYCIKNSISNISDISQNQYNGLLRYICKKYIKPSNVLKIQGDFYNRYDISKVESLCNWYIDFSFENDKEISLTGFTYLSGISDSVIYEWESNAYGRYDKASSERSDIAKKLREARENSLSNKLLSGKNPVGVLGILNHFYGWNMPGVRETREKSTGTLAELQKTAGLLSDNLTQKSGDQDAGTQLELSDN